MFTQRSNRASVMVLAIMAFVVGNNLATLFAQYTLPSPQCPPYYQTNKQACLTNPGAACKTFNDDEETCEYINKEKEEYRYENKNGDGDFGWQAGDKTQVVVGLSENTATCYTRMACFWVVNDGCAGDADTAVEYPQVILLTKPCPGGG